MFTKETWFQNPSCLLTSCVIGRKPFLLLGVLYHHNYMHKYTVVNTFELNKVNGCYFPNVTGIFIGLLCKWIIHFDLLFSLSMLSHGVLNEPVILSVKQV